MNLIIALFGLLIAALSAWGMIAPQRLIGFVLSVWHKPSGMYMAIGVRVVLGILFILAAPETKWPHVFEILGYIMLAAAVLIAIVGKDRLTRFIMWWVEKPPLAVRTWLVFGLAAGLLVFYGAI